MDWWIGQKIVCVKETVPSIRAMYPELTFPVLHKIYTIRGFLTEGGRFAIYLEEIINPVRNYSDLRGEAAFSPNYFRPLVDTEMDISVFTDILKQVEQETEVV